MWIHQQKWGGCDETQRESLTASRTEMQNVYLHNQECYVQFCRKEPTFDAEAQGKSQRGIRTEVSDVWKYLANLATGRQPH